MNDDTAAQATEEVDSFGIDPNTTATPAKNNDEFTWDKWLEEISQDTRSQDTDDKTISDETELY